MTAWATRLIKRRYLLPSAVIQTDTNQQSNRPLSNHAAFFSMPRIFSDYWYYCSCSLYILHCTFGTYCIYCSCR